ncbi:putative hydrolase [Gordonia effusa NBRC 100432]|uniref:Putative hydrolase n=1 Tax=Gordonia effusa NBRC 100432 TaxID=1077974 RepID=H0QZP0_9ACTN|nr:alpha/beta hydrolase [Gordonia effusa]GAB18291.1 putative hydrolase [Gordonia effusa NBRC 100432]
MRPRLILGACVTAATILLAGCATGPDTGPAAITGGNGGGDNPSPTTSNAPKAPVLQAPRTDLAWTDCAKSVLDRFKVAAPATGTAIECASFTSPIDPNADSEPLTIDAVRLRTASTPKNAPPVVLTTGTDLPAQRALLMLASGEGKSMLARNPVVAVEMRGSDSGSAIDCMTMIDASTIVNNGIAGYPGPLRAPANATTPQRIDRLAKAASSAADTCTDTLSPNQLSFSTQLAASDLNALRAKWGVDRLAILGLGSGADVALSYAAQYPDRVGRLILDTPTSFGANARDRAATSATGVQRALTSFAQRCSQLPQCALGANPQATIASVLSKANRGEFTDLSDTNVLTAITTALGTALTDADRVALAAAIGAADRGDTKSLTALVGVATRLRQSQPQLLSACNSSSGSVGLDQIPGLITTWTKQNPLTGTDAALGLVRCNGWGTTPAAKAPTAYVTPPLVLAATNDPINGSDVTTLGSGFAKAGTTPISLSWDGLGYSVLAHSSCAADTVSDYLKPEPLAGPAERACPS